MEVSNYWELKWTQSGDNFSVSHFTLLILGNLGNFKPARHSLKFTRVPPPYLQRVGGGQSDSSENTIPFLGLEAYI